MCSIVLLCDTLTTGGAETFVLRLAQALHDRGHDVRIAVLRGDRIESELTRSLAPDVRVLQCRPRGLRHLLRVDGLIQRIGIDFSWVRWLQSRWLIRELSERVTDIVHSHLITSDLVASLACVRTNTPWISTMHGDYLAFEATGGSLAARVPNFLRAVHFVEQSVSCIVCITEAQREQVQRLMPGLADQRGIRKIYNGYPQPTQKNEAFIPSPLKEIPPEALVVGMVSRGIQGKGWDVLLNAFRAANIPGAWLVLVGDGPRVAELRQSVQDLRVVFAGNVVNPLDYIARFDIACLPSRFPTESLPTVVIEYLAQGKPVVATHVGEIPTMLRVGSDKPAGISIRLGSEESMADEMCDALQMIAQDHDLWASMSAAAFAAFQPFDMDICVKRYEELYAEVAREN